MFRSSGERGISISEFGESPVRTVLSLNKSTQWDSQDSKSSGSSFLPGSDTTSRATQADLSIKKKVSDRVSVKSQTMEPLTEECSIQAFEQEPFEGLLSKQEVCDSIEVDRFIGLGMKGQPQATYENHSIMMKRVLDQGIVYQVIVIKEQYSKEQRVEKSTQEIGTDTGDLSDEVVIEDQEQEIEILEVVENKETKIKKEKEEIEEVNMFKEKPWTSLRKKIVSRQGNQVPEPVEDNRTPYQIRTESPSRARSMFTRNK